MILHTPDHMMCMPQGLHHILNIEHVTIRAVQYYNLDS